MGNTLKTNGLQERFNQTLERATAKFVNENHDDWEQHLDGILFSYCTTQHDNTKLTPFYVMFGRHPILPVDMDVNAAGNASAIDNTTTADTIRDLTKEIGSIWLTTRYRGQRGHLVRYPTSLPFLPRQPAATNRLPAPFPRHLAPTPASQHSSPATQETIPTRDLTSALARIS
ncbi:hypothetical protein O3P69_006438 [Scylla paramamosain]|uniref:Integrase catalytic domain-containing protein n=1 Tax=Scylla paramamosain TaxID=85552 RepID=A0AAW0U7B4_SCYPA